MEINTISEDEDNVRWVIHYTSLAALESMLSTKEIWASHFTTLNDVSEVTRFVDLVNAKAKKKIWELYADRFYVRTHSLKLIEKFYDALMSSNIFVFSTTIIDDPDVGDGDLSSWSHYGDKGCGAAIIFDLNAIDRGIEDSPIVVGKVSYLDNEEYENKANEFILSFFDGKIIFDINQFVFSYYEKLLYEALFVKPKAFSGEREYRFAYIYFRGVNPYYNNKVDYLIKGGKFSLVFKYDLVNDPGKLNSKINLEEFISNVIFGPCIKQPVEILAAKKLLNKHAPYLEYKAMFSKIPYRNSN